MGALHASGRDKKPVFRNPDELVDWIVRRLEQPEKPPETADVIATDEPEPRNDWERLDWIMRRLNKPEGTPAGSPWSGRPDGFDALEQPAQIDMRPGPYARLVGMDWLDAARAFVEGTLPSSGASAVAARERQRAYDVSQGPSRRRSPEPWEADAIRRAYQRDFGRMPTDEELNRDLGLADSPTSSFMGRTQHYRPPQPPGFMENYMAPIFRMFMPRPRPPEPNPPMFRAKEAKVVPELIQVIGSEIDAAHQQQGPR